MQAIKQITFLEMIEKAQYSRCPFDGRTNYCTNSGHFNMQLSEFISNINECEPILDLDKYSICRYGPRIMIETNIKKYNNKGLYGIEYPLKGIVQMLDEYKVKNGIGTSKNRGYIKTQCKSAFDYELTVLNQ